MTAILDPYTAGRVLAWARFTGDADMDATGTELNVGSGHATTQMVGERVTTALASQDQYAQERFAIANDETPASMSGVVVRKHATLATQTYYRGVKYHASGAYKIEKVVAGTPSVLVSGGATAWTVGAFHTLKLSAVGTTSVALKLYLDGSSTALLSATDSSSPINGTGAYVGHIAQGLFPAYVALDDFQADVITAGQTLTVGTASEIDTALPIAFVLSGHSAPPEPMTRRLLPYLVR